MLNVIRALFFRELKTRFGKNRHLGYFWVVGEPLMQILVITTLVTLIREYITNLSVPGGTPIFMFLACGIIPFFMFIFCTIWSLFASLLSAISKDFGNLVKSMVTAVFWLSGILWDANTINISWLKKLLMINPVTFLTNGFRNCFIYHNWIWEQPKRLLYFIIVTTLLLIRLKPSH